MLPSDSGRFFVGEVEQDAVVLVALVPCVPLQAQTPEIDDLRARAEAGEVVAQYDLRVRYEADTAPGSRRARFAY